MQACDGYLEAVSGGLQRLSGHPDLAVYTSLYEPEAEAAEAATVGDVVNGDEHYLQLRDSLQAALAQVKCMQASWHR